jgi:hypothetical protein
MLLLMGPLALPLLWQSPNVSRAAPVDLDDHRRRRGVAICLYALLDELALQAGSATLIIGFNVVYQPPWPIAEPLSCNRTDRECE